MAKIPGQKASHDDIGSAKREQIMKEIKAAQKADHCTETFKKK